MWIRSQLNKLTNYLVVCSEKTYKPYQIFMAMLVGPVLALFVMPVFFVLIGKRLDYIFNLGNLFSSHRVVAPSALAFCLGLVWVLWSIFTQRLQGGGTPLPLIPTKTLLVVGPYKYTRNPMVFGTMFWFLGWAFLANSPATLGMVIVFVIVLLAYIKLVEEKELEQRFGQDYVIYKKQTPFIIPWPIIRR